MLGDDYALDVAINGALNATVADPRAPRTVASAVRAELESGADLVDACAACQVAPATYLRWCADDTTLRREHDAALRIRAQLLAEEPLRIARHLGAVRRGERALPVGLTGAELASLGKAEAGMWAPGKSGGGSASEAAAIRHQVTISFAPPPPHVPATDSVTVAPITLSAEVPASYVALPALRDGDGDASGDSDARQDG
jgi:hypothetical protein